MSEEEHQNVNELEDNEEETLTKPIFKNGLFSNPWPTWRELGVANFLKWKLTSANNTNIPSNSKELDETLPVHMVTEQQMNEFYENADNKIKFLWIGHATCLINIENCVVLMDPMFSERCSPSQSFGTKRFRPVPITIEKIRRIDAVIISHNHYDHLDYDSIMQLNRKFGNSDDGIHWFVGAKLGDWFRSCGISKNIHELEWWQSKKYKNIEFVFTIAQHWSIRNPTDKNKTLWGSWTLIGPKKRFFFAGDTGYCSSFTEIGKKYGPFDLSAIPIGAYEPRFMMEPQHVDPDQAVQIHRDVRSRKSIGIHWGTFCLTNEFYLEPKEKLKNGIKSSNIDEDSFITIDHG